MRNVPLLVVLTYLAFGALIAFSGEGLLRFFLAAGLSFFGVGYMLLAALLPDQSELDAVEKLVISAVLSLAVNGIINFVLSRSYWALTLTSTYLATSSFVIICYLRYRASLKGERLPEAYLPEDFRALFDLFARWLGEGSHMKTQPVFDGLTALNSANLEELTSIPGIGKALAHRLMSARPFLSFSDVARVSGIGADRSNNIHSHFSKRTSPGGTDSPNEPFPHKSKGSRFATAWNPTTVLSGTLLIFLLSGGLFFIRSLSLDTQSPTFTEFYFLSENGSIDDFPQGITPGEPIQLRYGVQNYEGTDAYYLVQVVLGEKVIGSAAPFTLPDRGMREAVVEFTIQDRLEGSQKVTLVLLIDGQPSRYLHLWLSNSLLEGDV